LLDQDDRDEYFARFQAAFAAVGFERLRPVYISPENLLRVADLDGVDALFVGGGPTPAYRDAIVPSAGAYIRERVAAGMPYGGFSAGSAISPGRGIVGGWKLGPFVVCAEETSEDEEELAVRDGIGLVPFAVDVHASQWGTVSRLMHTVRAGLVPEGIAIDEDTMIECIGGEVSVHGLGGVYRVRRVEGALRVDIHTAGERFRT
ncbi:MAG TPA: Type 1 glutamine amidotransferase-like domain-containing protein, partial [Thermomicrobiales bacterium]|nr:Type 1 glutamine amidotransferase-like domain-containing protein [Thermomicrobiales bacterium]